MTHRMIVCALLALVAAAMAFVHPARAATPAHTSFVSSTPRDGAEVPHAPTEVTLTFTEDVNPNFVDVAVGGPLSKATQGEPRTDGPTVTQQLLADLPPGAYTVRYRVVSADGHPVAGSIRFSVESGMTIESTTRPPSASSDPAVPPQITPVPQPSPPAAGPSPSAARRALLWLLAAGGAAAAWGLARGRRRSSHEE